MEIFPFHPRIHASDLPLERLADNPQLSQPEKIKEVSRQFEAVFLRQILNQAQKPMFKSTAGGSPLSGDVYRDLVTNELADQLSRSGIGLARTLEAQLQRQLKTEGESVSSATREPYDRKA